MRNKAFIDDARKATLKLLAYCRANKWAGYDPYDALNSKIFKALPFLDFRFPRLAITQLLKRSPVNIRPLLLVPKTQNPKAIGLFLSAAVKLSNAGLAEAGGLADEMIERLITLRSKGTPYWCWGYSFPWQTRTIVVPTATPNLVCTAFVANALLDAYEDRQDPRCLTIAVSAAEYIANDLYWTDGGSAAGFSYPLRALRHEVYNANLLAAALLCRVHKHSGEKKLLDPALKAARHAAAQQHADGSWPYGNAPSQGWIDNFHTGYNLCALQSIGRDAGTHEFESIIARGFEFYRSHFFLEDGAVRYFHNRTHPIDIHCVAQSILTLVAFRDLAANNISLADSVLAWALHHMWDEQGSFYYRVLRLGTIRTSYMRWSQAWMLLAMASLLWEPARPAKEGACNREALTKTC